MARKKRNRQLQFTVRKQRISVILDKVLIFRFFKLLRGRFWGVTAIWIIIIGLAVCFLIRPELADTSTAFSDFGDDIRTTPYFVLTVFFSAYGLWRWRNYLSRTLQRSRPVTGLITVVILGLYLVALMPISWNELSYRIHVFGVFMVGSGMAAAVVVDSLLSKTRRSHSAPSWKLARGVAFFSILLGGWITYGSNSRIRWYDLSLIGESLMLFGFAVWVHLKTYQGDGNRSRLSQALKKFVLID